MICTVLFPCQKGDSRVIINILGANWAIIESNEADDDRLHDCDGCCYWTTREIVV